MLPKVWATIPRRDPLIALVRDSCTPLSCHLWLWSKANFRKGNCKNPQGPTCVAWVVITRKQGLFWAGYKPPLVYYKYQFKCSSAKESCWSAYVSFSYLCLLVQYTSLSSIRWASSMVVIELSVPMCVAQ